MSRIITLMPVRLAATRLPNKPLLDINGKSLVQRVFENVKKVMPADMDIAVAAGDQAIVDECNKFGATAVLTDPNLPSGTDRIAAALKVLDPKGDKYDIVVDFQGDNLNVDPSVTLPLVEMVEKTGCDIATCGMVIKNEADKTNPAVVKIVACILPVRPRLIPAIQKNAKIRICTSISGFMFSRRLLCRKWFPCQWAYWKPENLWNSCALWKTA